MKRIRVDNNLEFGSDEARLIYWGKIQDELVEQLKEWFVVQGEKKIEAKLKFYSDWMCPSDSLPRYQYESQTHNLIVFLGVDVYVEFELICAKFLQDAGGTLDVFLKDDKWTSDVYLERSYSSSQICVLDKYLKGTK
jgi:hypothetical protein